MSPEQSLIRQDRKLAISLADRRTSGRRPKMSKLNERVTESLSSEAITFAAQSDPSPRNASLSESPSPDRAGMVISPSSSSLKRKADGEVPLPARKSTKRNTGPKASAMIRKSTNVLFTGFPHKASASSAPASNSADHQSNAGLDSSGTLNGHDRHSELHNGDHRSLRHHAATPVKGSAVASGDPSSVSPASSDSSSTVPDRSSKRKPRAPKRAGAPLHCGFRLVHSTVPLQHS